MEKGALQSRVTYDDYLWKQNLHLKNVTSANGKREI